MNLVERSKKIEERAQLAVRIAWLSLFLALASLGFRFVSCYAKSQQPKPAEAEEVSK